MGQVYEFKQYSARARRNFLGMPAWLPLLAFIGGAAAAYSITSLRPALLKELAGPAPTVVFTSPRAPDNIQRVYFSHCDVAMQRNCVIDGDTIRYNGTKIRLADIDAPEVRDFKCVSELALGRRATKRLLDLMNAGPFDVVRAGDRDRDRYGRDLRVVERDGRSLGGILVAEGLARRWDGGRRGWCG